MQAPSFPGRGPEARLVVGSGRCFVFYWVVQDLEVTSLKRSMISSIATDAHFWVPVCVLILGTALLAVLR
jgi:hypothetical protein